MLLVFSLYLLLILTIFIIIIVVVLGEIAFLRILRFLLVSKLNYKILLTLSNYDLYITIKMKVSLLLNVEYVEVRYQFAFHNPQLKTLN